MNLTPLFIALTLAFMPQQQQRPTQTGPATASGPCSFATTADIRVVNYTCVIGQEHGQEMLVVLNNILANQLDPKVVMEKLEEILRTRSSGVTLTQQGQNGINIGPGAFAPNPQVLNVGLSPAEKAANKEKRERIASFMNDGLGLRRDCINHTLMWSILEKSILDWNSRTRQYLATLDPGWAITFSSATGFSASFGLPIEFQKFEDGINYIDPRMNALKTILSSIPVQ